jgi:hypothetical protein
VKYASAFLLLLALAACGNSKRPPVEDLQGREGLTAFQLVAVRGARDGDRLNAQAMFSDSSSMLTLEMRFAIGPPSKLATGAWRWARERQMSGTIAARSVTFLGGQDGPPSIGGTFDLLDSEGVARYRVNLPTTPLRALP